MQPSKTLESGSLQDQIRSRLEQDIHEGTLSPGMPIDEKALALSFNTSRTPVREALLLLSARGLVDIVPRSGIYVRQLRASELVAMMEALGELEGVLARLAALRIGPALREELQRALEVTGAAAAAQDAAAYQVANAALHDVIYRASGNPFIVEQARTVRLRIAAYRGRLFEKPGRLATSQREHERVVEWILQGHADNAAEAMREHISVGGKVFADLVLVNNLR
ncbi:GntR family transcriptional regulator [Variovorax sp. M-6]|uniref:GntR family transcriptional regulator n=1 Tax=Variovorax sp. M-6 TaxID=3233041 RepID=UPI003F95AE75